MAPAVILASAFQKWKDCFQDGLQDEQISKEGGREGGRGS